LKKPPTLPHLHKENKKWVVPIEQKDRTKEVLRNKRTKTIGIRRQLGIK
jgi:hypothetical protein